MRFLLALLAGLALPLSLRADDAPVFPASGSVVDLVYLGDSITASTSMPEDVRPPQMCTKALQAKFAGVSFFMSAQGHGGHTTGDFLPKEGATTGDFAEAETAAKKLQIDHPGLLVFSMMLGTNDSANSGHTGSPASAETYKANVKKIADALIAEFPGCKIVLQQPIWRSTPPDEGTDKGQAVVDRLNSYFPILAAIPAEYPSGQVALGDTKAYAAFEADPTTLLRDQKNPQGIPFRLHPNPQGSAMLAKFWADGIAAALAPQP
jgi:lysophospholipase L1-like esterase